MQTFLGSHAAVAVEGFLVAAWAPSAVRVGVGSAYNNENKY